MPTRTERKLKGLSSFSAIDKTTLPGTVYVLPTPTAPEIDPGITQILNLTQTPLGEQGVESIEVVGRQPLLTATFPAVTPQLLALRQMRQLETVTGAPFAYEKTFKATQNSYLAAGANIFGNGMPADQAGSLMSVMGPLGEAVPLTRVASGGFDPTALTNSFAQGADAAFQISDDVVGPDVSLSFPNTQDGLQLGENPITDLDISMLVLLSDLKLFRVAIPSVTVDLEASGNIPVGTGELSLTFRATTDGTICLPITYTFIGQAVAC